MLADRIALMLDGRLLQVDDPANFYQQPASVEVARFFGARNFVAGRVADGRFESALATFDASRVLPPDGAVMTIRQEAIELGPGPNAFSARVLRSMYLGTLQRVW